MGLIAIGDIHGCARTLEVLLDRLAPAAEDRLVFVGDYIDRGPDSKDVIERLLALQQEYDCVFLRGNHEALMLQYLDGRGFRMWQQNGGLATLRSYAENGQYGGGREIEIPEAHIDFVRATRPYYDLPDYFFVHGGLKPHLSVQENLRRYDEDVFLWERGHLQASELAWEKTVVCGHTPQPEPINRERLLAIDTGCCFHRHARLGRLTAVRLPERAFTTVDFVG